MVHAEFNCANGLRMCLLGTGLQPIRWRLLIATLASANTEHAWTFASQQSMILRIRAVCLPCGSGQRFSQGPPPLNLQPHNAQLPLSYGRAEL